MQIKFDADGIEITDPYGKVYSPKRHGEIEKLVNGLRLEVERCPQQEDIVVLMIANLRLSCKVWYVRTVYIEPDNKYVKPEFYGISYEVVLDRIDVLDEY